jgi:ATP-dependent RNA helicase SrmB
LRIASIVGGESYADQLNRLRHAPDLLIATPGRLQRLLAEDDLALYDTTFCVLDEADRMLDMGFGPEIVELLQLMPETRQVLLFSATLDESQVNEFASEYLNDPLLLGIGAARSVPSHIVQKAYFADNLEHKLALLRDIVEEEGRSMVFTYSRVRCEEVAGWLRAQGIECNLLHGEVPQKERNRILYQFTEGSRPILVTTDLAARGLHIEQVRRVVNFDLPRSAEIYVHRSGRTGRNGSDGESLLLVEGHDARLLGRIERYQRQQVFRDVRYGLEPKHREPEFKRKKKKRPDKKEAALSMKKRPKQRWRDQKNKGKPKGRLGGGKEKGKE